MVRKTIDEAKPHIAFNLLEEFHGVAVFDQHIAAYLELMKLPYTGCNPRGLMLAHDKPLSKKILSYHRILTPHFLVFERGQTIRLRHRYPYPLLVKSAIEEASLGISNKSIVRDRGCNCGSGSSMCMEELKTDALVEEYIEGRELYVGVLGNRRLQTFPVWEMIFKNLPDDVPNIATRRVKWDAAYQKKLGVETQRGRGAQSLAGSGHLAALQACLSRAVAQRLRPHGPAHDPGWAGLRAGSQPQPQPLVRRGFCRVGRSGGVVV